MNIYSPSDYIVLMRTARPRHPYIVNSIDFSFFKDFDGMSSNFSSIRPGKKAGDPVVTDVRGFQYRGNGEVLYKLRHRGLGAFAKQKADMYPSTSSEGIVQ